MIQQNKLFLTLSLLFMLCFCQAAFAQDPTVSIETVCSVSSGERNYSITNTSTVDANLLIAAGVDFVPLQLNAGDSYVYNTTATAIFV